MTKEQWIAKVDALELRIKKMENVTWDLRKKLLALDPSYEFDEKEDFGHNCDFDGERDALWEWINMTAQKLENLRFELINKDVIENK